jgi:hypothetical protein
MIGNALILTLTLLLALTFWLLGQLRFLIPYRPLLVQNYGGVILLAITVLFINIFAAVYFLQRKFFLKDTGRKLKHIDRQMVLEDSPLPAPMSGKEGR